MKFDKTEVFNFEGAFRGMRNPLESWDRSDSNYCTLDVDVDCNVCKLHGNGCNMMMTNGGAYIIGENDLKLAQRLILAGSEHSKFLRMIRVCVDVNMPRYLWSEMDTYGFNTKNSCSTMHRLLNNTMPITKNMFLTSEDDNDVTDIVINRLELLRQEYLKTKDYNQQIKLLVRAKKILPEGFLQLRTLEINYAELRNIYFQRRNHKLTEWSVDFVNWIKTLPYAEELIMVEKQENKTNMNITLISAKAQHGKDSTANILKELMEQEGKKVLITHYADLLKYLCKNFFDWNGEKDDKGRTILQRVGTDTIRKKQPDYWVDFLYDFLPMFENECDEIIIPDCRFPNEIEKMKKRFNVTTVRVNRTDFESPLTEEQQNHISETALDNYEFDYNIESKSGLDNLKVKVGYLYKHIKEDQLGK